MEIISALSLNQRGFFCGDQSITYPVKDETIPTSVLLSLCMFLVTFSVIILESWKVKSCRTVRFRCCATKCGHRLSRICQPILAGFTIFFIYWLVFIIDLLIKLSVGELRPNFIDVCKPNWSEINCTDSNGNLQYIFPIPCNETDNWSLQKARTSFPSGHATLPAFSVTVIILYLHEMFPKSSLRVLVQFVLVMFAYYMGISRVWDHMHHWWDVAAGFVFGTIWGYVVKKHFLGMYFPSVQSTSEKGDRLRVAENEKFIYKESV
ncbi:unnamed protein product [Meganyctiphanes norvegica]|uniref:Phosphatidic acid phosphatase type 2/haloperoxidase domain-containing protein n=1 Tax=Meganyctiphanes norvegica TaxID=48144 RepID=A0AAV2QQ60_MEGNR